MSEQQNNRILDRGPSTRGGETSFFEEPIHAPILVSWVEERRGGSSKVSFLTNVSLTLDDVFKHLRLKAGEAKNRITLLRMFSDSVAAQFTPAIDRQGYNKARRVRGKLDPAVFNRIMENLGANGWIKVTDAPKYVRQKGRYWMLTPAGEQQANSAP